MSTMTARGDDPVSVRHRVGSIAVATVGLLVLALVGLEAAGVDTPAWWLVVAFSALVAVYIL